MSEYLEQLQLDEARVNHKLCRALLKRRSRSKSRSIDDDDIAGQLLYLTLLITEAGYDLDGIVKPRWFGLTVSVVLRMAAVGLLIFCSILLAAPSVVKGLH
ncbi:hypothetical protein BOX15_Mlig012457g1 [Macrostomum lignano]|uniref:Uncharacterized protein n=2 Tax=Macrostomum lignano TaxID=282301 RepID=A0A267DSZ5_9PLAT|nr:hypothetical protein BOX15_Mlig012457g3 [Macrostomum lignano]PAA93626.1 hypothetical protein BOX15_Mlig012457g1 [Macrostomum lignano]